MITFDENKVVRVEDNAVIKVFHLVGEVEDYWQGKIKRSFWRVEITRRGQWIKKTRSCYFYFHSPLVGKSGLKPALLWLSKLPAKKELEKAYFEEIDKIAFDRAKENDK